MQPRKYGVARCNPVSGNLHVLRFESIGRAENYSSKCFLPISNCKAWLGACSWRHTFFTTAMLSIKEVLAPSLAQKFLDSTPLPYKHVEGAGDIHLRIVVTIISRRY